jgi:hypothetical protein
VPFEVALVETAEPPVYQRIARKAQHLRELGLSDRVIAARLGVTDKTVTKAVAWIERIRRRSKRLKPAAPSPAEGAGEDRTSLSTNHRSRGRSATPVTPGAP